MLENLSRLNSSRAYLLLRRPMHCQIIVVRDQNQDSEEGDQAKDDLHTGQPSSSRSTMVMISSTVRLPSAEMKRTT